MDRSAEYKKLEREFDSLMDAYQILWKALAKIKKQKSKQDPAAIADHAMVESQVFFFTHC